MDFPKFLEATGLLSESGLDISAAGRLAARFSKGHTLSDLIERPPHGLSEVPTRTLERLAYAYDLHKERRGEIRRLSKAREAARKPPLPTEVLDAPTYAHSVRALERVAQTGDAIKFPSRQEWVDALVAGVELWDRCFAIAWRDSQVISGAADEDHPRAEEYAEHVRQRVEPANLPSHRWLAMRRGEREGALSLRLEAAVESLSGQVEALAPRLGDLLAERSSLDLLQEAVLGSLEEEVFRSLDQEAEIGAMWGAASTYADLLRSEPLRLEQLHALHLPAPDAPAGLAVLDREGLLVDRASLSGEGWLDELAQRLEEAQAQALVVPAEPGDPDRLADLRRRLADRYALKAIRTAGLAQGRDLAELADDVPREVASAVVLGRRALRPFAEWSRVDPVSLGLAEYQADLPQDRLRRCLMEIRLVAKLRPDEESAPPLGALTSSFNPLVKDLSDLKAGMPVPGVITNITSFGAFVNIGLRQEGMIHISELADHFVKDPHEVVRVGQHVQAKVLAVDEARQRISLSLRTGERQPGARRPAPGPGGRSGGGGGGDRNKALADLEKLFKK